jgi:hypothetical protein
MLRDASQPQTRHIAISVEHFFQRVHLSEPLNGEVRFESEKLVHEDPRFFAPIQVPRANAAINMIPRLRCKNALFRLCYP